jgi:hypothetical protein
MRPGDGAFEKIHRSEFGTVSMGQIDVIIVFTAAYFAKESDTFWKKARFASFHPRGPGV